MTTRKNENAPFFGPIYNVSTGPTPELIKTLFGDVWRQGQKVPEGWRELTEVDFARSQFFTYTPSAIVYEQFWEVEDGVREDRPLICYCFLYNDKTGIAISTDHWAGRPHYYAFGCRHQFVTYTPSSTADEKTRCQVCGFTY